MLHRRPQAAFEQTARLWTWRRLEARSARGDADRGYCGDIPLCDPHRAPAWR